MSENEMNEPKELSEEERAAREDRLWTLMSKRSNWKKDTEWNSTSIPPNPFPPSSITRPIEPVSSPIRKTATVRRLLASFEARGMRLILPAEDECGKCLEVGYTICPGLLVKGSFMPIEIKTPCDCEKGVAALAEWQELQGCTCLYGRGYVTPNPDKSFHTETEACPKCEAGQFITERVRSFLQGKAKERINQVMHNAPNLIGKTFDTFETGPDRSKANQPWWAKVEVFRACRDKFSLILIGPEGIGKTHLAAAYLNHRASQGIPGMFVSLVDLMSTLRASINKEGGSDWDLILAEYVAAGVLVLDDLGKEKATDKTNEVLFYLLNSRINANRPTVVTTNFTLKELVDQIGYTPAIQSRLKGFVRVMWEAVDQRKDPWHNEQD